MRLRVLTRAVVLLCCALALGACGGGTNESDPAASPTSDLAAAKEQACAALKSGLEAVVDLIDGTETASEVAQTLGAAQDDLAEASEAYRAAGETVDADYLDEVSDGVGRLQVEVDGGTSLLDLGPAVKDFQDTTEGGSLDCTETAAGA